MLFDETFLTLSGGGGGNGMVSFFPNKSGPSGGKGGKGGSVYALANRSLTSLYSYSKKHTFEALSGGPGGSFQKTGADAPDLILEFPVGTELTDAKTGKVIVLSTDKLKQLLCVGGRGGQGNEYFKSATNRVPRHAEKGFPGEKRQFKVIMRLIAQVGLIGLPNAGKSSLLNELTAAQAKIAPYPFTTLEPNLGALGGFTESGGQKNIIIADIPGLIEGASEGKGLGTRFLKHVEKVEVLLHCISCEMPARDMAKTYEVVRKEMAAWNSSLLDKKEVVLLTKSDLIRPQDRPRKVEALKKVNPDVMCVSVHDADAIEALKTLILKLK